MADKVRVPSLIVPAGVFLTRHHTLRPASETSCCILERLQGFYGVANSYGAHIALGLQAEILDGKGNLTWTGFLNQPVASSTNGERTVGTITSPGTYKLLRCGLGRPIHAQEKVPNGPDH